MKLRTTSISTIGGTFPLPLFHHFVPLFPHFVPLCTTLYHFVPVFPRYVPLRTVTAFILIPPTQNRPGKWLRRHEPRCRRAGYKKSPAHVAGTKIGCGGW